MNPPSVICKCREEAGCKEILRGSRYPIMARFDCSSILGSISREVLDVIFGDVAYSTKIQHNSKDVLIMTSKNEYQTTLKNRIGRVL